MSSGTLCALFIAYLSIFLQEGDAIDTVPNLNVSQYLGRWYQASRASPRDHYNGLL